MFLEEVADRRWIDWTCGHGGVGSRIWKLMSGEELLLDSLFWEMATTGGAASQGSTWTRRWVRRRTREEKAAARLWGL